MLCAVGSLDGAEVGGVRTLQFSPRETLWAGAVGEARHAVNGLHRTRDPSGCGQVGDGRSGVRSDQHDRFALEAAGRHGGVLPRAER